MLYLSFDLSTNVIGVVCGDVINGKVEKIMSAPIIPPAYHSPNYMRSKKHLPCKNEVLSTWARQGEISITKKEKKHRDVEVRTEKDVFVLAYIAKEIDELIRSIKPNVILVEKNEIFNGVLTSVLLGKVIGVLHGVAGACGIPVIEYPVQEVRRPYDIFNRVISFSTGKTAEELCAIPDISKRVIRLMLEQKYNIRFLSDDESDAGLVFDYHVNYKGECNGFR